MSAWEMSLRARLGKDPWDAGVWEALLDEVAPAPVPPGQVAQARAAFEQLLARFPTAATYWQRYAEAEMAAGNNSQVKAIFNRCLLNCPNVPLWTYYLSFIKKVNEAKGAEGMGEVRKAYEYTLDRIGSSLGAGPLWQEYLGFLQAPRPGTPAYQALFAAPGPGAGPGQDDSHRTTVLRRAYHRAVGIPTNAVDALWRAYEAFEGSGANKQFVQRVLAEHRPRYTAARTALNELRRRLAGIQAQALAVPPGKGGGAQQRQMQLWQELLAWEKGNPQRLDGPALSARVALAYDEALTVLMHYPDVWYMYSRWHAAEGGGGPAAAAQVLGRACKVLPSCTMLHYAAADLKEAEGAIAEADAVYSALTTQLLPEGDDLSDNPAPQMELSSEEGTLLWIRYMRFLRRNDSVASSRKIFLRARKWAPIGWQVFVQSAYMEWHTERSDKVPRNIFELGFKAFGTQPDFLAAYVSFLLSQGDVDNARQLFERSLAEPKPPLAIWDAYVQFESEHGTLASLGSVEQRRREAAGEARAASDALHVMLLEHRELGLWPCSQPQREHLQRTLGLAPLLPEDPEPPAAAPGPHARTRQQQQQPPAQKPGHAPAAAPVPSTAPARPPPSGPRPLPQGGVSSRPPGEAAPSLPPELRSFLSSLPPPQPGDTAPAPVDTVIDVLLRTDLSPAAIAAAQQGMHHPTMHQVLPGVGAPAWAGQKRGFNDVMGPGMHIDVPSGMLGPLHNMARLKQQRL